MMTNNRMMAGCCVPVSPCDRDRMLEKVNCASFALDDVKLFLDINPTDCKALAYYEKYKALRDEAVAEYTAAFGPLNAYAVNCDTEWTWANGPWPWEGV